MTRHAVTIYIDQWEEQQGPSTVTKYSFGASPSTLSISGGDWVDFTYDERNDASTLVTLKVFNSALWSPSSDLALSTDGATYSRQSLDPAINTLDNITVDPFSSAWGSSKTLAITVNASVDSTPDAFSFTTVSNANRSQVYYSNSIVISGITSSISASISGGSATFKVNNGSYVTSATVYNGDVITLKMTSSSLWGTGTSTTFTAGASQAVWTVSTVADQSNYQKISVGLATGGIKISHIRDYFAGLSGKISEYIRGGSRVPNITENNAIPTSALNMKYSHFRNTKTTFYVKVAPSNIMVPDKDAGLGAQNFSVNWEVGVDWFLGYSSLMHQQAEFYYTYTVQASSGDSGMVSVSTGYTLGSWDSRNTDVQVAFAIPANQDTHFIVYVTCYARSKYNNSVIVSTTMQARAGSYF